MYGQSELKRRQSVRLGYVPIFLQHLKKVRVELSISPTVGEASLCNPVQKGEVRSRVLFGGCLSELVQ